MQPLRTGPTVAFGDFQRVVPKDRDAREVALNKSHDFSVQHVDGGDYLHRIAKEQSSRSPVSPDFSGCHWTPKKFRW